jgi:hypothetical protein
MAAAPSQQERQRADVNDFGATRGLSFQELTRADRRSAGFGAYDAAHVDRLESELEQARTALSALEEEAASEQLARIEADLLAHPHLPQAAFLMAECLALQALAVRPRDPTLADELERSRAALEGPRAAAFGEAAAAVPPAKRQAIRVTGISHIDRVELDGSELSVSTRAELAPGLHHVRVRRAGRAIFATFLRVQPGQAELPLQAPALAPCSADDLGTVRGADVARGGAVPAGIACERWALVRAEADGIAVALCERSRCGSFVHWQRSAAPLFTPLPVDRQRLPSWATFAIVGAAAAAATSVVLWQAGAFDSGNPNAASFRYAGVNPQGIRF